MLSLGWWLTVITSEWVTAVSTALLAIITALLGWLAYRQQRTTRAQLRAYLFPEDPRIEGVGALSYPKATLFVKNFGQTPAFGLTAEFDIVLDMYPTPTKSGIPKANELSRTDVGPGGKITIQISRDDALTSPEWEAIRSGKWALYVNGTLKFTDAFGVKWISTIRLVHTYRNLGTTTLEVCPEGNETRRA